MAVAKLSREAFLRIHGVHGALGEVSRAGATDGRLLSRPVTCFYAVSILRRRDMERDAVGPTSRVVPRSDRSGEQMGGEFHANGVLDSPSVAPTVCLVRAPAAETFRFTSITIAPPLGLAYIAGALEAAGERVAVVDAVASAPDRVHRYYKGYLIGLSFDETAARIPSGVDFIGISVLFTHEWPASLRLIDAIKRRHPDVPIILGGEHVSSLPEFCLLTSAADVLVLGEGEETLIELIHALRNEQPLDEIDGIAYRSGDDVVVNPRRQRTTEIDAIAWPAWHLFDLDTYHERRWIGGLYSSTKSVPILATRGCPYQCTYCSAPNMWTPRWIPRDPVKVVDEIQYYVEHFGVRKLSLPGPHRHHPT